MYASRTLHHHSVHSYCAPSTGKAVRGFTQDFSVIERCQHTNSSLNGHHPLCPLRMRNAPHALDAGRKPQNSVAPIPELEFLKERCGSLTNLRRAPFVIMPRLS